MTVSKETRQVYLLVDGENIDRTLGQILGRKPEPEERPRWDKIRNFVEKQYRAICKPLFFLNATEQVPGSFIQALKATNYIPIPLSGPTDTKIVDAGIIKTLQALKSQESAGEGPFHPVVLVSHDGDFTESFLALKNREKAVVAFQEYIAGGLERIPGCKIYDLEDDVRAFQTRQPLPRTRTIDIDDFDPFKYLGIAF